MQDSQYRGRDWLFTTEGHLFNISRIQSNAHLRSVSSFPLF